MSDLATHESAASTTRIGAYQAGESSVEILRQDATYRRAMPIVWCHGFFGTGRQAREGPYWRFLEEITRASRLPILAADLGGASTWANDTAIARIDTLLAWAASNLGTRTDRVVIAGESMGSLLALNWAWRNPVRTAAVVVRAPITALDAFHDRNAVFTSAIEGAYGGAAAYEAALPTHDPIQNRAALTGLGPVTRLDYTRDDEFIPPAEVIAHAAAVGAAAVQSWAGDHAANVYVRGSVVGDWLAETLADSIAA